MVLPDADRATVSRGYLLRPKYVDFADSSFDNVGAVLEKILLTITDRQDVNISGVHADLNNLRTHDRLLKVMPS